MQTKRKEKIEKNIDGFSHERLKALKYKINLRELYILRILIKIHNNYDLKSFITRDKRFVWIAYSLILDSVNGIKYTTKMLQRDLASLDASNLIDRHIDNSTGKSRVYFHLTRITREIFLFDLK